MKLMHGTLAALLLAAGFTVGVATHSVQSQDGGMGGAADGEAEPEGEKHESPLPAMLGRWEVEVHASGPEGDNVISGSAIREMVGPNLLQEIVKWKTDDGTEQSMFNAVQFDESTGRLAMTGVMFAEGQIGYGSGLRDKATGTWLIKMSDAAPMDVWCDFTHGTETHVDEEGNSTSNPLETWEMYFKGDDGEKVSMAKIICRPYKIPAWDMVKFVTHMTPSEGHAELAKWVGDWNMHLKMMPTEMEAMEMEGTVQCRSILGGRYIEEKVNYSGPMGPVDMVILHGYHNGTGKYQMAMIHSTATDMQTMEGKANPETGEIEYYGKMWSPDLGDDFDAKVVVTPIEEGKPHVTTIYFRMHDKYELALVITYTKAETKPETEGATKGE